MRRGTTTWSLFLPWRSSSLAPVTTPPSACPPRRSLPLLDGAYLNGATPALLDLR
jgi:hypothetical protein